MIYYKVKATSNSVRLYMFKGSVWRYNYTLTAGELITEKELKRFHLTPTFISNAFAKIDINKKLTTVVFGKRFIISEYMSSIKEV